MDLIIDEKWQRKSDSVQMRLTKEKVSNGIIQKMYENNILIMETFSSRPYKLGQSCDGTIEECVFALYYDFCKQKKLNSVDIYNKVYSDNKLTDEELKRCYHIALKEGITIPSIWNKEEFAGLLESLTEINNHSLVAYLNEISEFSQ